MQYHTIQQHMFDISHPVKNNAAILQDKISRLFYSTIFNAIELLFAQYIPTGEVIKIDTLEIDVGIIFWDDLETTLTEAITNALKEALHGYLSGRQQVGDITTQNGYDASNTLQKSQLGILEYYLVYGTMPWHASGKLAEPVWIMEQLLLANPALVTSLLLHISGPEYVEERVAHQFSDQTITQLIVALNPAAAGFIIRYHAQISALQQQRQLIKAQLKEVKKRIWQFILNYLLTEYSSVFSEKMFLKSNLHKISTYFNISYSLLLNMFFDVLRLNTGTFKTYGHLADIIHSLHDEETLGAVVAPSTSKPLINESQTYSGASVNYTAADTLKYFTLYGVMPWWIEDDASVSPAQLLAQLLGRNDTKALELLKFAGAAASTMERWVNNIPLALLQKLVSLLPQGDEALYASIVVIKATEAFLTSPHLTETSLKKLFLITLWKEFHRAGYTEIDKKKLIIHFITEIEFVLGERANYLVASLAKKIANAFISQKKVSFGNHFYLYTSSYLKQNSGGNAGIKAGYGQGNITWGADLALPAGLPANIYDVPFILGLLPASNAVLGDSTTAVGNNKQVDVATVKYIISHFLGTNKLPYENQDISTGAILHFFFSLPEFEMFELLATALAKQYSTEAVFYVYHTASFYPNKRKIFALLEEKLNKDAELVFYNNKGSAFHLPTVTNSNLPQSGAAFYDIESFITASNNSTLAGDALLTEAERMLTAFLLHNILPDEITKLPGHAADVFLKQLLILLMHKRPTALHNILQNDERIAANGIRLHYLFSKGEDIEQRTILQVLNVFIEDDIVSVFAGSQKRAAQKQPLSQFFVNWRQTVKEVDRAIFLHRLISAVPHLAYYLPYYLYEQELFDVAGQNTETLGKHLFATRQLQVIFQNLPLKQPEGKQILQHYQSYILLPYVNTNVFDDLVVLTSSFLTHLENENNILFAILHPALQNMAENMGARSPVIKNILPRFKQMLARHTPPYSKNKAQRPAPRQLATVTQTSNTGNAAKNNLKQREGAKTEYPRVKQNELAARPIEKIYIANAGIVLMHPFFPVYFTRLSLLENGKFVSPEAQLRAVHLLQYLVDGQSDHTEHTLPLNKILCNVPLEQPVDSGIEVTQYEAGVSEQLFSAVKQQWTKLQNTSVEGLRQSFLQREGILTQADDGWNLRVDQKAYDIILQTLPWGLSLVKFAWMDKILNVEWA